MSEINPMIFEVPRFEVTRNGAELISSGADYEDSGDGSERTLSASLRDPGLLVIREPVLLA